MATVISAYNCWMLTKKPLSEDGTTSDGEEELEDIIKLHRPHVQTETHQIVGSWGYLMQATYQVSQSRSHFCCICLDFSGLLVLGSSIHALFCIPFCLKFKCDDPASS